MGLNDHFVDRVKNFEEIFSKNKYDGSKGKEFVIKKGSIPIMVSAPHAVNHFRNGSMKKADIFTGSIAYLMHEITGCHLICALNQRSSDANYSPEEDSIYKRELKNYIDGNNIKVLIDLHGCNSSKPCSVELGTINEDLLSLRDYKFIKDLFVYSIQHFLKNNDKKEIFINKEFKASNENTITNYIFRECSISSIQLEVNNTLRNLNNEDNYEGFCDFIKAFEYIIKTLAKVDWRADDFKALKVKQAKKHKPQDAVYLNSKKTFSFKDLKELNSFLGNNNFGLSDSDGKIELIHINDYPRGENNSDVESDNFIAITNRLIKQIFSREWITLEDLNKESSLLGIPIILHIYKKMEFTMGLPKADKIENITFSYKLYNDVKNLFNSHDFYIYNKYLDSKIQINTEKSDYGDGGRVCENNRPASRIMVPRYYKLLMECLYYPLQIIRKEEYELILENLNENQKSVFSKYYKKMPGENFYSLNKINSDEEDINEIIRCQMEIVNKKIELIILPKSVNEDKTALEFIKILKIKLLEFYVGSSSVFLRSSWANETDDKYGIVKVSPNVMELLGLDNNDKVVLNYNNINLSVRILSDSECEDLIIKIPATIRLNLGMNNIGNIVTVSRDMEYNFKRHSIEQAITFLGTLITVASLEYSVIVKVLITIIVFPTMVWWTLNEERIKVK